MPDAALNRQSMTAEVLNTEELEPAQASASVTAPVTLMVVAAGATPLMKVLVGKLASDVLV
jgi:hypothetical protein